MSYNYVHTTRERGLNSTTHLAALSSLHYYLIKIISDFKLMLPPPSVSMKRNGSNASDSSEYNISSSVVAATLEHIELQVAKNTIPHVSHRIVRNWLKEDMHWDVDKKRLVMVKSDNYTSASLISFIQALVKLDHLLSSHTRSGERSIDKNENIVSCIYVPFSMSWIKSREAYSDEIHFQDMNIYHQRNIAAFNACNLTFFDHDKLISTPKSIHI
jgi:hypothetical protein